MHRDGHTWNVQIVKDRYSFLQLSDEQAEQVFLFEDNSRQHKGETFFTDWEQWDYELHFFSQILDKDQLKKFNQRQQKAIKWYVKGLETVHEQDAKKKLDYTAEIIAYFEQEWLPGIFESVPQIGFAPSYQEQSTLKAEYKKFLQESRRRLLINHFKAYRTHCPITLKASLLSHKIFYLWPEYASFLHGADEPSKSVAAFLESRLAYIPKETDVFLENKAKKASKFVGEIGVKYYPELPVFTYGHRSPEKERRERLMSYLLLDKDAYGWNPSLLT